MRAWLRQRWIAVALAGTLALAAGSGFLVSQALGGAQQAPTATVTVDVGTGARGEPGPPGPPGPKGDPGVPGAESCPPGSTFRAVLFNAPGGQTTIYTCVKD